MVDTIDHPLREAVQRRRTLTYYALQGETEMNLALTRLDEKSVAGHLYSMSRASRFVTRFAQ